MSLEQAVQSLEETIKTLITVMQSGSAITSAASAAPAAPAPAAPAAPKKTKEVTKYFHIPKHNTVAEVKPGEAAPTIESTVEVTKAEFDKLKADYAAKPAELSFKTVVEKITEMSKLTGPGRGREGVKALLTHFTGKTEAVRVPDLEPLGKNADILAATQKLIDTGSLGEPEVGDDDLGL